MKRVARSLKKYFIPHRENDHQPHILREEATLFVLGLVLVFEFIFLLDVLVILPRSDFLADVLPAVLVGETNHNREADDMPLLNTSAILEYAAQLKADDMAEKGYFSHVTPDGKTPWYFFDKAGYAFAAAGENLAVNFFDSKDVADAWMASPGHRANILNADFTEIGVATAHGNYQGSEAVFVVQFFGTPAGSIVPETAQKLSVIPEAIASSIPTETEAAQSEVKSAILLDSSPTVKEESFVAVKNETAEPVESKAQIQSAPSFFSTLLSSPRSSLNYLYFAILAVISLALFLKIFIKIRIQYPKLIANGVLMLAAVSAILLANQYLSVIGTRIS